MQGVSPGKKNSCTSSARKKKFVQAENPPPPPPPITFLMIRPLFASASKSEYLASFLDWDSCACLTFCLCLRQPRFYVESALVNALVSLVKTRLYGEQRYRSRPIYDFFFCLTFFATAKVFQFHCNDLPHIYHFSSVVQTHVYVYASSPMGVN